MRYIEAIREDVGRYIKPFLDFVDGLFVAQLRPAYAGAGAPFPNRRDYTRRDPDRDSLGGYVSFSKHGGTKHKSERLIKIPISNTSVTEVHKDRVPSGETLPGYIARACRLSSKRVAAFLKDLERGGKRGRRNGSSRRR